MLIEEGSPLEEKLLNLLKDEYGRERDGVHVSDILLCIRQNVYRKLQPTKISEKELSFYALGEGAHLSLQRLVENGGAVTEKVITLNGITGTVDVFDGVPIEIKTTRSHDDSTKSFHITQLKYYMAITKSNVGILLYFMMNDYERPFRFRTVTLSDKELDEARSEIKERGALFTEALLSRDPFKAPHVKNESDLAWKCKYCQYKEQCWSKEN